MRAVWRHSKLPATAGFARAFAFAAAGCSSASPDWERTVPVGHYDVGAPRCKSTNAAPDYPAASFAAALHNFDELTERTITVAENATSEIFRDSDCSLEVKRTLFKNYDGEFTQRGDRKNVFDPAGCTLGVKFRSFVYPVGTGYTTLFDDSGDQQEDVPFAAAKDETGYELTSLGRTGYDGVWANFGCAASDAIQIHLGN